MSLFLFEGKNPTWDHLLLLVKCPSVVYFVCLAPLENRLTEDCSIICEHIKMVLKH